MIERVSSVQKRLLTSFALIVLGGDESADSRLVDSLRFSSLLFSSALLDGCNGARMTTLFSSCLVCRFQGSANEAIDF